MMSQRKKVLHITIHLPFPTNHGASLFNSYKLCTWLHRNHDLHFACFLKGDDVRYTDAFLEDTGITNYYFEVLNVPRSGMNLIKSYLKGMTINMFRNYSPSMHMHIQSIAHQYDVIVAEHYEVMQYVPKDYKGKVVFRTHNAEFLIWSRYAEVETNPIKKLVVSMEADRIKKWEFRYVKEADIVLGGTNDNEVHEPDPVKRAAKFRDYLHIGDDSQISLPIPDFEKLHNSLLYVGTLTWEANVEGLLWFVEGCWHALKERYPELKLFIVGKNPDQRLVHMAQQHEGIVITGFVEDLEEYFMQCKVNIIPLRFGSGMKVKTINGLCRGIPMVCTDIGAEGLKVTHDHDILIANDHEAFIRHVAELLDDPQKWNHLAHNSKQTARKYYTWESLYKILEENI